VYKILTLLLLISSDLIIKRWVFHSIELNNFLSLTFFFDVAHIHNFGISFGLFSGMISPFFLILIGLIVTVIICYMMIRAENKMEKWGLTIIIAGALSNIIDRMMNGYVLDFIYLHYKDFYWPAFNFADIYISVGVFIIVFQLLKDMYKKVIT